MNNQNRKVIVIGAGIAGLSAAIYAARSGFDVTLIEQHKNAGGTCTSWKRKGYLFEGAMHWLTGSSPDTAMYQVWRDVGALGADVPVLLKDPFSGVECDGQIIYLYRDINKTAEHLIAVSPEDAKLIKQLAKEVKTACKMQMPVFDIKGVKAENPKRMTPGYLFKMTPALPVINKYGKLTCGEFTGRFKHPGIRRLFQIVPAQSKASDLIFTLATLHSRDGGYPKGGSLPLTMRMVKTFTDLGGRLLLDTKVKKVRVNNGETDGVTLTDDSAINADAVIVTLETVAALNRLFDTPPRDEWLLNLPKTVKPLVCTFVSIGVRAELSDGMLPGWILDKPIICAEKEITEIGFNSYRDYAPPGGTALTTALLGNTYLFWRKAKDEGRYEDEKHKLAEQFRRALCEKYPQCEGKIEVIDIATPLTYERYTGAFHGSWMAVMEPGDKMTQYPGDCEIDGLYFAGHRIMTPGGLPVAAVTGRQAAQLVCRQFGAVFK
jgi:phytoene dehydrogenase-like protein